MTTLDKLGGQLSFADLLKRPVLLLAFGFGSGLSPKAPGTVGTVVGVILFLLMKDLTMLQYSVTVLVMALIGIPICSAASNYLGVHDHGGIVWDEIVGYLITMAFLPSGMVWILAGFIGFRLFDILKPWPICVLDQRVSGGLGIMLDDIVAAMIAGGGLWLLSLNV
ncbi:MAG: phosphatidylglycerophosphatase A [Gammaproteobacteria bacterium]